MELKPKEKKKTKHPVVDVTGDGSKVQCCKNNNIAWEPRILGP